MTGTPPEGLGRYFSKEGLGMANRHMKNMLKRSANQNYNEAIPVRMAIINMSRNNKCWRVCGEKATFLHCWWECKLEQPLWKTVWKNLRKLHIEQPNWDPANPLLGIYLDKTFTEKDKCTPMFITVLFTIAKTWKQPKCPSRDEWIKKRWYIYTMEYYSALKRQTNAICNIIHGTRDSQTK
uniref:Uncharacterized protein n=1 Tax=Sus scrofa TaxID=9823 RepID=A0A8D1YW68_PIG